MNDNLLTRKIGVHMLFAALVGLIVFAGYSRFPVTAFTPELCNEVAVASGLRPATDVFHGLWRLIAKALPMTPEAFGVVGRLSAGFFASLAYFLLFNSFRILVNPILLVRSLPIASAASFTSAVMMAFANPVWQAFCLFSPTALTLVLLMLCVVFAQSWFIQQRFWQAGLFSLLIGLAASETPLAIFIAVHLFLTYRWLLTSYLENASVPEETFNRIVSLPALRMALLVVVGLVLGIALNIHHIARSSALVLFRYFAAYALGLSSAASAIGWLLGVVLTVIPLIVLINLFPRLTNDQFEVTPRCGILLLLVGCLAYFQQGPIYEAKFWMWSVDDTLLSSPLLKATFSIYASTTIAFVFVTFASQIFIRLKGQLLSSLGELVCRGVIVAVWILSVGGCLWGVSHTPFRRLLAFNDRVVRETVRETKGASWLFTDGSCDTALELEARRQHQELFAINLMSAATDGDLPLIRRGPLDAGDRRVAEAGASALLRFWACEKPDGLSSAALQLGLDLWKRERNLVPPVASAFVARTNGLRPEDVSQASQIATAFGDEMVRLASDATSLSVPLSVRRQFFRQMWRLSRLSRFRGDNDLADRLDACNATLRQLKRDIESERVRVFLQMTPREGLELALRRADFAEAARHAASVRAVDEDDPRANFAMGMHYLLASRYEEAEPYLRQVLAKRPNEVAALNNLSILCRRTNRPAEALELAERALKLMPECEEVRETYREAGGGR